MNDVVALDALRRVGPCGGLEVLRASDGALKLGSVHFVLDKLSERGLVTSERKAKHKDDGTFSKRIFAITAAGMSALRSHVARFTAPAPIVATA